MTTAAVNSLGIILAQVESDHEVSQAGAWPVSGRIEDNLAGNQPANPSTGGLESGSASQGEVFTFTTPALRQQRETQALTHKSGTSPAPDAGFTWGSYFQAIGVMVLLLVGLWFVLRLIKRSKGSGYTRFNAAKSTLNRDDLILEAQLPLGQNKNVSVVRFLNKRLVLGVTDHQINLLDEAAIYDQEAQPPDFQTVFDEEQP